MVSCQLVQTPQEVAAHVAPSVPEAERRQLTVLFCDLVDSTAPRQAARSRRPPRGGAGLSGDLRRGDRPL